MLFTNKGLISSELDKKWLREDKFNRIENPGKIEEENETVENETVDIKIFPIEELVDNIDEDRTRKICGKQIDHNFVAKLNQVRSEIIAEKGKCTIADIMAKMK